MFSLTVISHQQVSIQSDRTHQAIDSLPTKNPLGEIAITILHDEAEIVLTPPSKGLYGRITGCFDSWSLSRKIMVTFLAAALFAALIAAMRAAANIDYNSAENILGQLSVVGAPYLNASVTPAMQEIFANITAYTTKYCASAPVHDRNLIQAADTTLTLLKSQFVKQATLSVTNISFFPTQFNTTLSAANSLFSSAFFYNACFVGGCQGYGTIASLNWPDWVSLYPQTIDLETLRKGAAVALQILSARTGLQPLGGICQPLPGVQDLIKLIGTAKGIWPPS